MNRFAGDVPRAAVCVAVACATTFGLWHLIGFTPSWMFVAGVWCVYGGEFAARRSLAVLDAWRGREGAAR